MPSTLLSVGGKPQPILLKDPVSPPTPKCAAFKGAGTSRVKSASRARANRPLELRFAASELHGRNAAGAFSSGVTTSVVSSPLVTTSSLYRMSDLI